MMERRHCRLQQRVRVCRRRIPVRQEGLMKNLGAPAPTKSITGIAVCGPLLCPNVGKLINLFVGGVYLCFSHLHQLTTMYRDRSPSESKPSHHHHRHHHHSDRHESDRSERRERSSKHSPERHSSKSLPVSSRRERSRSR